MAMICVYIRLQQPPFIFNDFFRRPLLTCPHCSMMYTIYMYVCTSEYTVHPVYYIVLNKPAGGGVTLSKQTYLYMYK
jgi:hypothetical protein